MLQLHLSGGEPTVRRDLEQIVAAAAKAGLYSNLITAAVLLTRDRLQKLAEAGLDHVQISVQDAEPGNADRIAHYAGGHAKKMEAAGWVRELGLPLTINAPVHRQNIDRLPAIIELAERLGARRLEVAHVQYYGWALQNRRALMPTREQVVRSADLVAQARERLKGILVIDFVAPDYYAARPKPCMGGWGRGIINITPSGKVLPCHAAESIPGLAFENVRNRPLRDIWLASEAFQKFRGTDWMREPCRSCELARGRLGRLPMPGACLHWCGRGSRPGVRQVCAPRRLHPHRRGRVGGRRPGFHLPQAAKAGARGVEGCNKR